MHQRGRGGEEMKMERFVNGSKRSGAARHGSGRASEVSNETNHE
jgi:hypothetical protein